MLTNQSHMEVQTEEVENGTKITVKADQDIALSVISGGKERIYLPYQFSNNSTYYVEDSSVENTSAGFSIIHTRPVDQIDVIKD